MSLNNKGDFGTKVCIIEEDKNQSSNKKKFDFKAFWSWIINNLAKTTNGMAIGLFGTLIIGTIFSQIALIPGLKEIEAWAKVIKSLMGAGIGTSMLQFKNIVKKPIIWLPTIIASGILGVFAYVFKIMTDSVGAGMGTSGLIGPLNTFASMNYDWKSILIVLAFTVVTPAILVFLIDLLFRKIGWIKKGDFALKNEL